MIIISDDKNGVTPINDGHWYLITINPVYARNTKNKTLTVKIFTPDQVPFNQYKDYELVVKNQTGAG